MKKIILGALVAVIIAIGIFFGFSQKKEESYRVIEVLEVTGSVSVERTDMDRMDAYQGMRLQSGDQISVDEESWLKIRMDEDKYALIEPNSRLRLEASGNSTDSKTVIHLEEGAITNRLDNKLSQDSVYEVSTPNSTMAVRGTLFRADVALSNISIDRDKLTSNQNIASMTRVSVYEGTVTSRLVYPDGQVEPENNAREIGAGYGAQIIGNANTSEYLNTDAENDLMSLEDPTIQFLRETLEAGTVLRSQRRELEEQLNRMKDITGTESEIQTETELQTEEAEYTVTFRYNGTDFATQSVLRGEAASVPVLQPAATGNWDYDFSAPVMEDTVIDWKE